MGSPRQGAPQDAPGQGGRGRQGFSLTRTPASWFSTSTSPSAWRPTTPRTWGAPWATSRRQCRLA
eukprot:4271874-Pyramimonas_sp.AAC.1